jgi:hypothetical protein
MLNSQSQITVARTMEMEWTEILRPARIFALPIFLLDAAAALRQGKATDGTQLENHRNSPRRG